MISLPLATDRLLIRPFMLDDAEAIHELWGDDDGMRYIPSDTAASVDETRERLRRLLARDTGGWGFWALVERDGARVVGGAGLFPAAWQGPEIEVAYHIVPGAWGRGYATEAAGALVQAAFGQTPLARVVAFVAPGNGRSQRVLEKIGMACEGETDYAGMATLRYALERPE